MEVKRQDLLTWMAGYWRSRDEEKLRFAFKLMDGEKKGRVTISDFAHFVQSVFDLNGLTLSKFDPREPAPQSCSVANLRELTIPIFWVCS